jgi:hypothetical protein
MLSQLFAGDAVLQAVADDLDRISRTQHRQSESTRLVQVALLIWDPGCLPARGADGDYFDETAAAVARFKRDELGVPPEEIIDDVGPRTVIRLDEIAAADEHGLGREVAVITVDGLDSDKWGGIVDAAETVGGSLLMILNDRAAVLDGGPDVADVVVQTVPDLVAAVVTASGVGLPGDLDADTFEAVSAWLASVDPVRIVEQLRTWSSAESLGFLQGCGQDEVV